MRAFLIVAAIVVLAATGAALALGWEGELARRRDPVTVDAYVDGERTPLSSHLSGYVRRVLVRDNQLVHAGETILEMVDDDYRASVAQAEAQADAARAALAALGDKREVLRQQVVQAQDSIAAATAQLTHSFNEVRRQQLLLPTAAGLLQSLQSAQADLRRNEAQRAQATAQVAVNERQLDLLNAQLLQAQAQLREADAQSRLAQIALGYTRIVSPIDGALGVREVHEGALLAPGTEVDTVTPLDKVYVTANFTERQITIQLVPRNDVWVVANFRETQLRNMRVGQPARLTFDAYPGITLAGHVDSIEPGSEALGSLLPPERAVGNFTKIAQRVPVKIRIDAGQARQNELSGRLLPGLSVEAAVDTSAQPGAAPLGQREAAQPRAARAPVPAPQPAPASRP